MTHPIETLLEAELALDLGYLAPRDVIGVVNAIFDATPALHDQPLLAEIVILNPRNGRHVADAQTLLREHNAASNTPAGRAPEDTARALLKARLEQYLAGQCEPWDVCGLVHPIEQRFDFPAWLDDLFNQCDWCKPGARRDEWPHLAGYARQLIAKL